MRLEQQYDVVVVGGGPAGLGAALVLARARRSVRVVDDDRPRNAAATHVHSYLGLEGVAPRDFLAAARAQVASYGADVTGGSVTHVEALPGRRNEGILASFRVVTDGQIPVRARRLVLATGTVDTLPDIAGLAERWGRDVHHCPYCHGWEMRDRAIGIVGTLAASLSQALVVRQWSDRIVYLQHAAPAPSAEELARLEARGIEFLPERVTQVEVHDDRISGVRFASGSVRHVEHLVLLPQRSARTVPGLDLLIVRQGKGDLDDTVVETSLTGATAVPGVWAAGNVGNARGMVLESASAGLVVGVAVNEDLVLEDLRMALLKKAHRHP